MYIIYNVLHTIERTVCHVATQPVRARVVFSMKRACLGLSVPKYTPVIIRRTVLLTVGRVLRERGQKRE